MKKVLKMIGKVLGIILLVILVIGIANSGSSDHAFR